MGEPVKHPRGRFTVSRGEITETFKVLKLKFMGKNKLQQKSRINILLSWLPCACWSPRPRPLPRPLPWAPRLPGGLGTEAALGLLWESEDVGGGGEFL